MNSAISKPTMRILLVDDEMEMADPLSLMLKREGYQVDVTYDGDRGLNMAMANPYDLFILDWMMPGPSGLEICDHLRRQGNSTPVLILTAKDTVDDRVAGLDAGADDYLIKPFELRELMARVRALLRRPTAPGPSPSATILEVDGLTLNIPNQTAQRENRTIELSEKETQLLACLMQTPHTLLTHDQIYQAVWADDSSPNSNTLAAQIRLLRRKIDRSDELALIQTVYGKGYRFGLVGG
jgi:two-component system, OmpR family, manganese sensing response regulator